ncbi:R3H domain-containing protein 1-like isoform X2 [Lampetra planeri]
MQMNRVQFEKLGKSIETDMERPFTGNKLEKPELHLADTNDIPIIHKARISAAKSEQGATVVAAGVEQRSLTNAARTPHREQPPGAMVQSKSTQNSLSDNTTSSDPTIAEFSMQPSRVEAATTVAAREQQEMEMPSIVIELDTTGTEEGELSAAALGCVSDGAEVVATAGAERLGIAHEHNGPRGDAPSIVFVHGDVPGFAKGRAGAGNGEREHGLEQPPGLSVLLVHDSRGEDDREASRAEPDPATDQQRRPQNQGATRKRTKSNAKMKLVRSLAVCDDPSPPPASDAGVQDNQEPHAGGREEESVLRDKDRGSERATAERQEKMPKVPRILSRDSSQEYTDSTGVDVHEFLVNTLKNNPRDRMMLLKMEQELMEFVQDNKQHYRKFPPMTSYHRMLVHRVAAYFGMDHNVDQTGKAVVVNKTPGTRIPEQRFSVHLKDEARAEESQKRFILKRDNSSMDRDDMQRIRPLQDERRSKSFEEREEEYQRVRDRIFAQDSLSSQELPQIEIRIQEDGCSSNNTLKRRQIFSRGKKDSGRLTNGSGQGGSGESELRPAEPRPWSSTDLESSGFRLARPAITKASSFGGISVLARGDSCSGGGKSNTGRLSKTGSETSSSGGSLSGSQARPPHPSSSGGPQGPHSSSGGTGGGGSLGAPVGAPGGPNYYLLSLDNAGIPPGSVLINPQTGQPLLNTDGTLAVYNPPNGGQQHQHQQPMGNHLGGPPPSHQPMGGHMVAPPNQQPPQQQAHSSGGMMTQPGQYSVVSYPPPAAAPTHLPTSPQSLMPVLSAQQSYPVPEELGPHFSQLSLGQPTAGDASEPSHAHVYHAIVPQNSAQPPTYLGQHLQPGGFPPPSAAANSATQQHQQQQQQQQAYGQSQPHGQMPIYFCPPAQYQPSSQQYRAVAPVQYGTPRGQQPGYQSVGPSYGPIQPPHSQGLMGGQQGTVGSPAQGPMGNTMQGVMVQYTPMTSYHMSQSGPQAPPPPAPPPQQSYQPPVLMGGGQQLYCNVGPPPPPPPPPNNMSGSGVSYLHPPSMEQLQFRTPSPAGSQPTQGQHYATGLSPSGHGVFVMQLSLPSSPHPPRTAASPTRWGQRRGLSLDQRLPRTSEHGGTEGINQVSPRLSSPMASPVQSPNSSPMAALGSIRPGLLPLPLVQSRPIAPKQGDGRYPLAGPAVQYCPQTCGLQPPHLHMAVSLQQVKTGGRGKRHPRKALSEDTSSVEQVSDMCSPGDRGYPRPDLIPPASATLEVLDLPHGISRLEADALLGKLAAAGGEIHWLQDARMEQGQTAAASSLAGCSAGRYNAKLGSTVDTEKHTPGSNGEQKSHWDVRREVPVVATSRIDVASGPKAHLEGSCPSDSGHAEAKTQLRDFSSTVGTNPRGLPEFDGGSGAFPNPASERGNGSSALRQDLASHYKVVAVFPTRQLAQSALAKLGHGTGSGFRLRPIRRRYEAHTLERASSH